MLHFLSYFYGFVVSAKKEAPKIDASSLFVALWAISKLFQHEC